MRKKVVAKKAKLVKSSVSPSVNSEVVYDIIKKANDAHEAIDKKMCEMVQMCGGCPSKAARK